MALGLTLAAVSTLALSNGRAMLGPVDQMAASVQNDPIAAQAAIERMASTLGAPPAGFARSGATGPARVAGVGVGTPLVPASAAPPAAQAAAAPPVDDAFGSGGPLDGAQLAGLGTPFTGAGAGAGGGGNGGVGGGGVPGSLPGGGGGGGFVGALPGDGGTDGGGNGGGGTGDTGGGDTGGGGNNGGGDGGTPTPTAPIPEPGSWMMMILGIGMIGAALRRRRVPVCGDVATA
ncbi:PEPxxWA-CTERM sorting domain-containing protein [Sphingomonas sp.]